MLSLAARYCERILSRSENDTTKQKPKQTTTTIPPHIVPSQITLANPPEKGLSKRAFTEFSKAMLEDSSEFDSELDSELDLHSPLSPETPTQKAKDESDSISYLEMQNNRLDYELWQYTIPILEAHLPLEPDTDIQKFIAGIKIQLSKINVQDAYSLSEGVISLKTYVAHHHDDHISFFDKLVYQHVPQETLKSLESRIKTVKKTIKTNQAMRPGQL